MTTRAVRVLVALASLAACSGRSDPAALASAELGEPGGQLVVSYGAVSLTVPAGALAADVALRIDRDADSPIDGLVAIGGAFSFGPADTAFTKSATIVLPFDFAAAATGTLPSQILVAQRRADGSLRTIPPTTVDADGGSLSVATSELGTFWTVVPFMAATADLWPLATGDSYSFDSGLVLRIDRGSNEPILAPTSVVKLDFVFIGVTSGLYLDDSDGLALLGAWSDEVRPTYQQILSRPLPWLGPNLAAGDTVVGGADTALYQPFGSLVPAALGSVTGTTTIDARVDLETPLGTFHGVFPTRIELRPFGAFPFDTIDLWLAPGVGPVRARFDDGPVEDLIGGSVDGMPIVAR